MTTACHPFARRRRHHCPEVQDLSQLKGLALTVLYIDDTKVKDLEPLKDIPLKTLYVDATGITDLRPLQAMQLEDIRLTSKNITQGLDDLRDMKSLKTIGLSHYQAWPATEFWERLAKGEFKN
jgi:Leucine-rich repeat (LRR) protein